MTMVEYLGEGDKLPAGAAAIQIFATDIDEQAILTARRGIYPERIAAEVSPERLRRFFVRVTNGYQVNKTLRELCVFAVQNVVKDPPFSRLDLVCCRNLLIYFGPVLQKRVLEVFHYALEPDGFLMLGVSESIGAHADLFALVEQPSKIFVKKSVASRGIHDFAPRALPLDVPQGSTTDRTLRRLSGLGRSPQEEAEELILARYSPPGVIVTADWDILDFRGQTGRFLEPAPGAASLNLLKMVRRGLFVALRAALTEARAGTVPVSKAGVRYQHEGAPVQVDLQVLPLRATAGAAPCFLVLFEEVTAASPGAPAADGAGSVPAAVNPERDDYIASLERELASTRDYMQAAIAEQEGTNEELRSLE